MSTTCLYYTEQTIGRKNKHDIQYGIVNYTIQHVVMYIIVCVHIIIFLTLLYFLYYISNCDLKVKISWEWLCGTIIIFIV